MMDGNKDIVMAATSLRKSTVVWHLFSLKSNFASGSSQFFSSSAFELKSTGC